MTKKLAYLKIFLYLCKVFKRYNMNEKNTLEKLLRQLSADRDEKIRLLDLADSQAKEIARLNASIYEIKESGKLSESTLLLTIKTLQDQLSQMSDQLEKQAQLIQHLEHELAKQRGKRFGRSSEQKDLLNNRMQDDDREKEKEDCDGPSVGDGASASSDTAATAHAAGTGKKRKTVKLYEPEPDGAAKVDDTIIHKLGSYYQLPEGARFMMKDGKVATFCYTTIERIPERIIRHVYEVASVIMPDDSIVQTMDTPHVIDRCPLDPSLLAWILVEKYVYHSPINTVKKKLRNAGANFSKSVLGRYFHQGMQALMDLLKDTMHSEIQKAKYLMVDETAELVGVTDEDTDERHYRKKYLWAFFDKLRNMVAYVYENGSRARKVVCDFLAHFSGSISTDGYVAYSVFDDAEKHPNVTHVGCWTHARRLFVEALESERKECTAIINEIGELFAIEIKAKVQKLDELGRKTLRQNESIHVLAMLAAHLARLARDTEIMANPLMKKAVTYAQNQWQSLCNYITDGKVEISNNLCEQRMKTVKLTIKNCQNIGSEDAAVRSAFFQSLTESCLLNKINPLEYITDLLTRIYRGDEITNKVALLPCNWKPNC